MTGREQTRLDTVERITRSLRAARDRKQSHDPNLDFLRELAVDGLQALDALLTELEQAERERDDLFHALTRVMT